MAAPAPASGTPPSPSALPPSGLVTKFTNVWVLRNHELVLDDLWVRGSTIIDPAARFWDSSRAGERTAADRVVDGGGRILAPGYIDLQLNGAFGYDFSNPADMAPAQPGEEEDKTTAICRGILRHGVTSIYATVITSAPNTYAQLQPLVKRRQGSAKTGAHILGVHLEGPFITVAGAHPPALMRDGKAKSAANGSNPNPFHLCSEHSPSPSPSASSAPSPASAFASSSTPPRRGMGGLAEVREVYGEDLSEVGIITLAAELDGIDEVISTLSAPPHNIVISQGHSRASYSESVRALRQGATLVTHLFNAMVSFHHRDPGIIGLIGAPEATEPQLKHGGEAPPTNYAVTVSPRDSHLPPTPMPTALSSPPPPRLFYSLIVDGLHTHPASVAIAYRAHPRGVVLVTDAMLAMGLRDGDYKFGEISVEIRNQEAHVAGTNTLAGSIATMERCVQNFHAYTGCSVVEALEAASLHPAQCMRLRSKGSLDVGMDADLILLDPDTLQVQGCWVMGEMAWKEEGDRITIQEEQR